MKCPYCGRKEDKVIDSRATASAAGVRRRRECSGCGRRFTTYEYVEEVSLMVVKKDGRRQPFDRQKIIAGITRACEKRPVGVEKIEEVTARIERALQKKSGREVASSRIGELVMEKLKSLDDVAYVRFASVYRQFRDVGQFMQELKEIVGSRRPAKARRHAKRKGGKS
jgi:transcriptional repressor NrdR